MSMSMIDHLLTSLFEAIVQLIDHILTRFLEAIVEFIRHSS